MKREEGLIYKDISNLMNEMNFTTRNGRKFTPQQVWGLHYKIKKRIQRLNRRERPKILRVFVSKK